MWEAAEETASERERDGGGGIAEEPEIETDGWDWVVEGVERQKKTS